MESVPKPAYLNIWLNEERIARFGDVDFLTLRVRIGWRQPQQVPTILSTLSDIPEAPSDHRFEVLRQTDGKYTLIPEGYGRFRFGKGPLFIDLARQGDYVPFAEYLEYGNNMIKKYQPDFDYTQSEEQAYILLGTLKRLNEVREKLQGLREYLWYARPHKTEKAMPPVKEPERDIRAAVLQDVIGMSTRDIGDTLGFKPPKDSQIKRENAAVRAAAQRGRQLLEHYFGADGWRQKVEWMREERTRWLAMEDQPKKQIYYLLAEYRGTSLAEEEKVGQQDGFDHLLEEWIAALERDDPSTAAKIRDMDPRFEQAIYKLT
jgi:hypothetical protein